MKNLPSEEMPAARIPPMARTAMPMIFRAAVTVAERSTHWLPTRFTNAAAAMASTARTGTQSTDDCIPKGRRMYVPKVRPRRLSAMTIDTYMKRESEPAATPGPYAALRSIAIPPDDGFVAE